MLFTVEACSHSTDFWDRRRADFTLTFIDTSKCSSEKFSKLSVNITPALFTKTSIARKERKSFGQNKALAHRWARKFKKVQGKKTHEIEVK